MANDLPCVVALVPAWNAAEFIQATLDSLAAQTYKNVRVLISNDASTDATGEICERYASQDGRFSVLHQTENLGWIGNVNVLLRAAEGDYFFFAFHDDILMPRYVEALVTVLEDDPAAILAFSDIELFLVDGALSTQSFPDLDGVLDRYERVRIMAQKPPYNWIPNRGLFRAHAAEMVGGLRRNLAGEFVADWPWLLSLLVLGSFVRVPQVLCRKIYKEKSVSIGWTHTPFKRAAVVLACARVIQQGPFTHGERLRLYRTLYRSYPPQIRRWLAHQPFIRQVRRLLTVNQGPASSPDPAQGKQ